MLRRPAVCSTATYESKWYIDWHPYRRPTCLRWHWTLLSWQLDDQGLVVLLSIGELGLDFPLIIISKHL